MSALSLLSSSNTVTRQPMCPGDKIQLPTINRGQIGNYIKNASGDVVISSSGSSSTITMNNTILNNDLCYNRCPNGEAPQVDGNTGQYFCLVPALVTYQIKRGDPDAKPATNDSIDYESTSPYTVSCQSTDILNISEPQFNNKGNTMYGVPLLLKSGLYEDPLPPNTVRSSNYIPSGDFKWFCKRVMSGAPPLGSIQSPYESISQEITKNAENIKTNIKKTCNPIDRSSSINGSAALESEDSKSLDECPPDYSLSQEAVNSLSGGLRIVQTTPAENSVGLAVQNASASNPIVITGSVVQQNPNTGEVTRVCNASIPGDCNPIQPASQSVGFMGISTK
jgi:hypothetical protein